MEKPKKYILHKNINWFSFIAKNIVGLVLLDILGFGFLKLTPNMHDINRDKADFYMDLANSDSECRKYIDDIKRAANADVPNKEAAKEAYRNFKIAFRRLNPAEKWRNRKSNYSY